MSNRGERELECLYTVKKDIILEPNMHTFWFGTTNEDIKNVKDAFRCIRRWRVAAGAALSGHWPPHQRPLGAAECI